MHRDRSIPSDHDSNNDHATTQSPADNTINGHGNGPTSFRSRGGPSITLDHELDDIEGQRPSKKRKLAGSTLERQRPASRPVSPPWKKVTVDGPTSFIENGRRKSARTNAAPSSPQHSPKNRRTSSLNVRGRRAGGRSRRSADQNGTDVGRPQVRACDAPHTETLRSLKPATGSQGTQGTRRPLMTPKNTRNALVNSSLSSQANRKPTPGHSPPDQDHASNTAITKLSLNEQSRESRAKRGASPDSASLQHPGEKPISTIASSDPKKPRRLKLRVRQPKIPALSSQQVLPPRRFANLSDWLRHQPILDDEERIEPLNHQKSRNEAQIRLRILSAARPGGILDPDHCSLNQLERQDEPLLSFSHWDHVVAHGTNFSKLMKAEKARHARKAKEIAYLCAEAWKNRQPKTETETFAAQRETYMAMWKQVNRDLHQKWDMVIAEVDRRRGVRYKEEQERMQKQALEEYLHHQTNQLDKRRNRQTSDDSDARIETQTQIHNGGSSTSFDTESESDGGSHMSSSQSSAAHGDNDVETRGDPFTDGEEDLSLEELRRKYAIAPDVNWNSFQGFDLDHEETAVLNMSDDGSVSTDVDASRRAGAYPDLEEVDDVMTDDSDDTIDMEDNSSSCDEGEDEEEEEEEEASTEDDEARPGQNSLLGFFSKRDLAGLAVEQSGEGSEEFEEEEGEREDSEGEGEWFTTDEKEESQDRPPSSSLLGSFTGPHVESVNHQLPRTPVSNEEYIYGSGDADSSKPIPLELADQSSPQPPDNILVDAQASESSANITRGDANSGCLPSPRPSLSTRIEGSDSILEMEALEKGKEQTKSLNPSCSKGLKTKVPHLLRGTLRDYQHFGLDWLAGLYASNENGILADEMGLGKTIQTIALLAHLAVDHEVWGPHLVVVPTSVMLNWELEFKKWCPGFKILTYYGSQDERKQKRKGWLDDNRWNVCITSYQLVLQDAQAFKRRKWHYLILDEAHNIKNFRSQRWQTMLTFKTRARLLLTGTPLQNNLTELWSLVYFIKQGDVAEFADLKGFQDWFRKVEHILEYGRDAMDEEGKSLVTKLQTVLRPHLLRRLKADVEQQMPAKYEHIMYCRLSKRQRQLYDGYMGLAQTKESFASGNYMSIINCLMQLRKVCNHPDLFETRPIVTSFSMPKSAIADYEIKELLVRKRLLGEDPMKVLDLDLFNLALARNEGRSAITARRSNALRATHVHRDMIKYLTHQLDVPKSPPSSPLQHAFSSLELSARRSRLDELRKCLWITHMRSEKWPQLGSSLMAKLDLGMQVHPLRPRPKELQRWSDWYLSSSSVAGNMIQTLEQRADSLCTIIEKFACTTPAVTAPDLVSLALNRPGISAIEETNDIANPDPFHQSRVHLSIAFPDRRLLQYDCGKLQRLAQLLLDLRARGSRALIFTQMTKVLDILEQFLNIHGYRYLRLDGATKIEQRQILTERFNSDPRILCFILSSRSGGLGINLTGADSVIFYDLDWNPAMDKQCQDRCHRIGQTRDVHIYRFVSEYTIEANILRKSNQKRMLDDVVIQEGDFTTDYFHRPHWKDALDDVAATEDDEANIAVDRFLGAVNGLDNAEALEAVEDKEDTDAARVARKEEIQTDDADFDDRVGQEALKSSGPVTPSGKEEAPQPSNAVQVETSLQAAQSGLSVPPGAFRRQEEEPGHVDDYMVALVEWELRDSPYLPPKEKKKRDKIGRARDRTKDRGRKR